jgi:hypothetical protein
LKNIVTVGYTQESLPEHHSASALYASASLHVRNITWNEEQKLAQVYQGNQAEFLAWRFFQQFGTLNPPAMEVFSGSDYGRHEPDLTFQGLNVHVKSFDGREEAKKYPWFGSILLQETWLRNVSDDDVIAIVSRVSESEYRLECLLEVREARKYLKPPVNPRQKAKALFLKDLL